jgi:hypothetical protein
MDQVIGGYRAVELNDGTEGNYSVAMQYFRMLRDEQKRRPDLFREACHRVLRGVEGSEDLCAKIAHWGTAEQVAVAIKLCARETRLSQVFSYVAGQKRLPDYELVSPFKQASQESPLHVPDEHLKSCMYEYVGDEFQNPYNNIRPV